jgi:AraC-like DNA-binding protein
MRALFEHVQFAPGCSVRVYHRRQSFIPFEWHSHPVYELTLTMNSRGMRHVGTSVAAYGEEDLVLLPPDLPHSWVSDKTDCDGTMPSAVVVWFDGDWLRRIAACCPEYTRLPRLLQRAEGGLAFGRETGHRIREHLGGLLAGTAHERLATVLTVLCLLSEADAQPLSASAAPAHADRQPARIARILALIGSRFGEPLSVPMLAHAACLSPRSLNREFHRHVGESVGRYLARVRIAHACRLLAQTCLPIGVIALQAGFRSQTHFNRQFRQQQTMTPAAYRHAHSGAEPAGETPPLCSRPISLERAAAREAD